MKANRRCHHQVALLVRGSGTLPERLMTTSIPVLTSHTASAATWQAWQASAVTSRSSGSALARSLKLAKLR
ncbi:hypothetical protein WJX84_002238 [Apatococcus fuscideae]|uniref:Uncharacterized protein n=1 Tax=Apatococcus fuscideae TaxID=2026836 RepID=A0AAW1SP68_9CHLO